MDLSRIDLWIVSAGIGSRIQVGHPRPAALEPISRLERTGPVQRQWRVARAPKLLAAEARSGILSHL